MAAVSVRNRVDPKVTGIKLFWSAISISLTLKSPSGPIKIVIFSFLFGFIVHSLKTKCTFTANKLNYNMDIFVGSLPFKLKEEDYDSLKDWKSYAEFFIIKKGDFNKRTF